MRYRSEARWEGKLRVFASSAVNPDSTRFQVGDVFNATVTIDGIDHTYLLRIKGIKYPYRSNEVVLTVESERGSFPSLDVETSADDPDETLPSASGITTNIFAWEPPVELHGITHQETTLAILAERPSTFAGEWSGAQVWLSDDGGSSYGTEAVLPDWNPCLYGETDETISAGETEIDITFEGVDVSTILVDQNDAEQADDTLLLIIPTSNNRAEVASIGDVTALGGDSYRLTVLRGRMGTNATSKGSTGESVYVARRSDLQFIESTAMSHGNGIHFKVQSQNWAQAEDLSSVPAQSLTLALATTDVPQVTLTKDPSSSLEVGQRVTFTASVTDSNDDLKGIEIVIQHSGEPEQILTRREDLSGGSDTVRVDFILLAAVSTTVTARAWDVRGRDKGEGSDSDTFTPGTPSTPVVSPLHGSFYVVYQGLNSVFLNWGGAAPFFLVEYKRNADTDWTFAGIAERQTDYATNGNDSTIHGLDPGTAYDFRVWGLQEGDNPGAKSSSSLSKTNFTPFLARTPSLSDSVSVSPGVDATITVDTSVGSTTPGGDVLDVDPDWITIEWAKGASSTSVIASGGGFREPEFPSFEYVVTVDDTYRYRVRGWYGRANVSTDSGWQSVVVSGI